MIDIFDLLYNNDPETKVLGFDLLPHYERHQNLFFGDLKNGRGDGYGYGDGYSHGNGYGNGNVDGFGCGDGYMAGFGNGYGCGKGYGSGNGPAYADGNGYWEMSSKDGEYENE